MRLSMYYEILLWMCSIGFLASVPLVLAVRARRPQRMPWWLVVVLAAALGWIASNLYAFLEDRQISAKQTEAFREEHAFAHFFQDTHPSVTLPWGWVPGLLYLIACAGLYRLFHAEVNSGASRS